jgi:hypothetical protein
VAVTEWDSAFDADKGIESALADLETERAKLGKLSELWREGRSTIRSKDQSLSMTFDGRGELLELVFNESKYRALAPKQLASIVLETMRRGREQSIEKMSELMGVTTVVGLDMTEVASGRADPQEMLDALISPMLKTLDSIGSPVAAQMAPQRKEE